MAGIGAAGGIGDRVGDRRPATVARDVGPELFENAVATAAGLFVIIVMFGPVSGAHLHPVVSLVDATFGGLKWRDALAYVPAQITGSAAGAILANGMFRAGGGEHLHRSPR